MPTEDPPVIEHSSTCCCQYCSWEDSYTPTYGLQDRNAVSPVEVTVRKETTSFSLHYLLLCSFVCLVLGIVMTLYYNGSRSGDEGSYSHYYQDLNSVEIKFGSQPLDPEVIKAVHHFQNAPFGYFSGLKENKPIQEIPVERSFVTIEVDLLYLFGLVLRLFCFVAVLFFFYVCYIN
uniref:Triple gene block protein 3 n=1 Tax=Soil-borne virus 2 TaxID=1770234 RepID=A0A0U2QF78_9VIRU|nr:triple gene block protein 3 [Soil-borne virus 2]